MQKIEQFFDKLSDVEIWHVFAYAKKELRERGLVRTNNIVGERGEFLVEELYRNTPTLTNLQKAPEGTQNVDAISRKGERYTIKTVTYPSRTTGVFYGIDKDEVEPEKKFEYLVIVVLERDLQLLHMYEIDWDTFLRHKKWHSRMKAFNITITKKLVAEAKIVY